MCFISGLVGAGKRRFPLRSVSSAPQHPRRSKSTPETPRGTCRTTVGALKMQQPHGTYLGAALGPAKPDPRTDSGGCCRPPVTQAVAVEPPVQRQEPPHVLYSRVKLRERVMKRALMEPARSGGLFFSAGNPTRQNR